MARGDQISHPSGWEFRFGDRQAEVGWRSVVAHAPANAATAWGQIVRNPRAFSEHQHQLKGKLRTGTYRGRTLEQWQYEVTGGGRLWYLIDDEAETVWLIHAGTGHPKATE